MWGGLKAPPDVLEKDEQISRLQMENESYKSELESWKSKYMELSSTLNAIASESDENSALASLQERYEKQSEEFRQATEEHTRQMERDIAFVAQIEMEIETLRNSLMFEQETLAATRKESSIQIAHLHKELEKEKLANAVLKEQVVPTSPIRHELSTDTFSSLEEEVEYLRTTLQEKENELKFQVQSELSETQIQNKGQGKGHYNFFSIYTRRQVV